LKDYLKAKCEPVTPESDPVEGEQLDELLVRFKDWRAVKQDDNTRLRREFEFDDFTDGAKFAAAIAEHADEQGYHPQIVLEYGEVRVDWWTSDIPQLHENDFIMAAKTDDIYSRWELITGERAKHAKNLARESFVHINQVYVLKR